MRNVHPVTLVALVATASSLLMYTVFERVGLSPTTEAVHAPAVLSISQQIEFESSKDMDQIQLKNLGADKLRWTAHPSVSWISIDPAYGELAVKEERRVSVTLDREALKRIYAADRNEYAEEFFQQYVNFDYGEALKASTSVSGYHNIGLGGVQFWASVEGVDWIEFDGVKSWKILKRTKQPDAYPPSKYPSKSCNLGNAVNDPPHVRPDVAVAEGIEVEIDHWHVQRMPGAYTWRYSVKGLVRGPNVAMLSDGMCNYIELK